MNAVRGSEEAFDLDETGTLMEDTLTLFRPVGRAELDLIRDAAFERFPPRLPEQPIFYPVVEEEYARKIARDWNARGAEAGYVTRFRVRLSYISRYAPQMAGGRDHTEYWIPAEELETFNDNIIGRIEVVETFREGTWSVAYDLSTDTETITTAGFGVVPDVALFGSADWWAAIEDGRIPSHEAAGRISRVYFTGHGDWPQFDVDSNGTTTSWTRLGENATYVEGNLAVVTYVNQTLRAGNVYKQVVRILLKE